MLKAITDAEGHARGFIYCDSRATDLVIYSRKSPEEELTPLGAYHLRHTNTALYGTDPTDDPGYVNQANPEPES